MPFRLESVHLGEVKVIVPSSFPDDRGFFMEAYRADLFAELGIAGPFTQDNHSGSHRGVVRGLHFQWDPPMGKLMRVTAGAAFVVAVDIRPGSPTLGEWFGIEASAENRLMVWAPACFARGFCAVSDWAEVQYKCTAVYNADGEGGIRWSDPSLAIAWPVDEPSVSDKDAAAPTLAEWLERPEAQRFRYKA